MKLFYCISTILIFLCNCSVASTHILVQNQYFPKSGKEEEVYELRLHASDVRKDLGLRKGRVLRRANITDRPYVMWECEFPSIKDRENDVAILNKSEEFKHIENRMSKLVNKFERIIWKYADD